MCYLQDLSRPLQDLYTILQNKSGYTKKTETARDQFPGSKVRRAILGPVSHRGLFSRETEKGSGGEEESRGRSSAKAWVQGEVGFSLSPTGALEQDLYHKVSSTQSKRAGLLYAHIHQSLAIKENASSQASPG